MTTMKLFTIVKDEIDIVAEWVHYHGRLLGYTNLYIIDNMSTDGTYEKLLDLQSAYGCSVVQRPNYARKGKYMTQLISEYCSHKNESGNYATPIAYPINVAALANYLSASGSHHVKHRIDILNNTFKLPTESFDAAKPISESHISLAPLSATFVE